ncbi:hypothetical protein AUK10_04285 [Candidatus Gracilibacteria bacterium CG2_30_37_12]|nr:MAG: hypothetical protein AUK10_04285 [Candidatus Gracilibacteria bacterium CG2_30_37_12]
MIPQQAFEIREVKPARKIQLQGDTINLENILIKTVSTGLFSKPSITLKLRTGEILTYEVSKSEMEALFKR